MGVYLARVEKVANLSKHPNDVPERLALLQLLHADLEIHEMLGYLDLDGLEIELEEPELETRLDLANRRQVEQEELGTTERYVRIGLLGFQNLLLLLIGGQHGEEFFDALFRNYRAVHFDDGRFDHARRWQGCHADHDHVGTLGVQDCDLFLALTFLKRQRIEKIKKSD